MIELNQAPTKTGVIGMSIGGKVKHFRNLRGIPQGILIPLSRSRFSTDKKLPFRNGVPTEKEPICIHGKLQVNIL